ncbi:hypothetical protein DN752_19215 [Echinicola strongylocentroti]|uniref:DUF4625 domain-containing protein n=1 Tax=Echinicola strongylocentroti TaxID=1795355 RepID=A0A2Z4IMM5_9BACT|nr:DUF4625 domain-containing protein [Echinicola strongylocentroti]AWW32094.1 hypothetical protein DN752_19215 [Echinicola strongylocentroti]
MNYRDIRNIPLFVLMITLAVSGCEMNEDEKDVDPPVIDNTFAGAFPTQCAVISRGASFELKVVFRDNMELGSYSLDVHHNFDHHTHSTEVNDCEMDPVKSPDNPFLLIDTYSIPSGLQTYEAVQQIAVPADVDPGDYHFMIKVTDKEGWQTIQGISIKIN